MNEKKIILGIETSCDETAVSIIEEDKNGKIKILSNVVSSQFDIHKEFGGVVPELAARSHVCLLYTSPSPRDKRQSRMPSSA